MSPEMTPRHTIKPLKSSDQPAIAAKTPGKTPAKATTEQLGPPVATDPKTPGPKDCSEYE